MRTKLARKGSQITSTLTDSLVNWSSHHVAGEQGDKDHREANEGAVDEHDVMGILILLQRGVMQATADQCDDLKVN